MGLFLGFVVDQTLSGRGGRLKAFSVAREVYGRDETFDARSDAVVRVEAGRLRRRLAAYYEGVGRDDPIRIDLPKAEAVRTEADRATMENFATRPENFVTVDHADKLAELIPDDRKTAVREVPRELWNSNLMLLLIVLLLTGEWIIRKKYNMA